jgi:antitoxin (DNA-binding transcriptional repressor) of toxin-antitoxin stability system
MEKVPITRLKAAIAAFIAKVKAGHTLVITDHGQAVAVFEPLAWDSEDHEAMNQLVRTGQVSPPTQELPDDFFETPKVKDPEGSLRAYLSEERGTGR